jgi:ribosome-binding factor A
MIPMSSIKIERLENTFVEEISKIIRNNIKDKDIQFVTITASKISSDLSYAKIYFTTLNDEKRNDITKSLNKASSFIRSELCQKINIRKMPELTFIYDESIEYGNKIEHIIQNLKDSEDNG